MFSGKRDFQFWQRPHEGSVHKVPPKLDIPVCLTHGFRVCFKNTHVRNADTPMKVAKEVAIKKLVDPCLGSANIEKKTTTLSSWRINTSILSAGSSQDTGVAIPNLLPQLTFLWPLWLWILEDLANTASSEIGPLWHHQAGST